MKALLDASVAVSFVHPEETSDPVRRWVARWIGGGSTLTVPRHFWLEVINTLAISKRYDGAAIIEAIHQLRDLSIETVDLDEATLILVIDAVERHGLTSYDAQYVALAEQLDAQLVTLDRQLLAAAGPRGIDPIAQTRHLAESLAPYGVTRPVTWPDYSGTASYLASLRARLKASTPTA